jgi:histidinol-phosphate phosphatase family protein
MSIINQAVIFCGGLGTRLKPLTKKLPKPMVQINNKPFLQYLIEQCKQNGIKNFLLLCGYKHEVIKNFFGNGKKFGVSIKYHYNPPNIQTFKRIYEARKKLFSNFLLMYADNYSSLNLIDLVDHHKKYKSKFTISVCKKKRGNINLKKSKNEIDKYYFKKNIKADFVDIGYMILEKKFFLQNLNNKNISFSAFINESTKQKKANYYINDTDYLSISDLKRYNNTKKFFNEKYILIDRDGVLNLKNKNHYYVRNLDELKINYLLIKKLKKIINKRKLICITNQAGISTGDLNSKNLKKINKKIKVELKKNKIELKEFFISTHHFKSNNFLRKPNHGLFLKAAKKYNFILDRTFYIGDDLRDIEASYRSKTRCMYIGKEKLSMKLKKKYINTLL